MKSKKTYRFIKGEDSKRLSSALSADDTKSAFRELRERECFPIINRGQPWYDTLTSVQKYELSEWYRAWLDVTETLNIPEKPSWIK